MLNPLRRRPLLSIAIVTGLMALSMGQPTALAAASPTPVGVAGPDHAQVGSGAAKELADLKTAVRALDPYVVRAADGTLSLQAPARVVSHLNPRVVAHLHDHLATVNAAVRRGDLQTTVNRRVFNPRNRSLTIQAGGGVSQVVYYWWGIQLWLDEGDTQTLETALDDAADTAAICTVWAAYIQDPDLALECGLSAAYFKLLSQEAKDVDTNKDGVILWFFYTPPYYISGQP